MKLTKTPRNLTIALTFLLGILSYFLFNSSLTAQETASGTGSNPRNITVYVPHVLDQGFAAGGKVDYYPDGQDTFTYTSHTMRIAPIKMSLNETVHFSLVSDTTGLYLERPFYSSDSFYFVNVKEMYFHRNQGGVWTPLYQEIIHAPDSQNVLLIVDDSYHCCNFDPLTPPAPYNDLNFFDSAQVNLSTRDTEGTTTLSFDVFLITGITGGYPSPDYSSGVEVHIRVPVIITKN